MYLLTREDSLKEYVYFGFKMSFISNGDHFLRNYKFSSED